LHFHPITMKALSAFLLLLFAVQLPAQDIFQRVYDCTSGNIRSVEAVGNGTYAGYDFRDAQFNNRQGLGVVKYDADQVPIWNKAYLSPGVNTDLFLSEMATTSDGGLVLGGIKRAALLDSAFVMKVNGDGDVLWTRVMPSALVTGAAPGSKASVLNVAAAANGDVLATGYYSYVLAGDAVWKAFLTRISATGTVLWTKSYVSSVDPDTHNRAFDVRALPGGGLLLLGLTGVDGSWLARLEDDGTVVWSTRYSTTNGFDVLVPMEVFPTGTGFHIFLQPSPNDPDLAVLLRANANGVLQSAQRYTTGQGWAATNGVAELPSSGYLFSSITNPSMAFGLDNLHLLVTDANGTPTLSQSFGSDESEYGLAATMAPNGGYLVGGGAAYVDLDDHRGGTPPRPFLVKTNTQGDYTCGEGITVTVVDTAFTSEPRALVVGSISGWVSTSMTSEVFLNSVTVCPTVGIDEADVTPFQVLPNPASDLLTIVPPDGAIWDHALLDATGRVVLSHPRTIGQLQVDVSGIAPGRFVLRSASGMAVRSTAVLVVR